jgi:hypothetical protein
MDIGLTGIAAFLAASFLIGAGGFAAVVGLIAAWAAGPSPWESRSQRVGRYLAGPMACLAIGVLCAVVGSDDLAAVCALIGIIGGAAVQIVANRNNDRRRNAWLAEGKPIEPGEVQRLR